VESYTRRYGLDAVQSFTSGFGNFASPQNPFYAGKIAMEFQGVWMDNYVGQFAPGMEYGVAPWPTAAPGLDNFTVADLDVLAIPRGARHPREAWEFIKFMCFNKEQQINAFKSLDAYPALIEAGNDSFIDQPMPFLGGQKARQLWKVAAAKTPGIAVNKLDSVASDVVGAELEQVLEKDKDIKQALADAKSQIERRVRR